MNLSQVPHKRAKRERCTELCTKPKIGKCFLCNALDEADTLWRRSGLLMVTQWLVNLYSYVTGLEGWRAVGVFVGAYIGLYAIMESLHERQMNSALFEQNRFMTLAASGSPGGVNAALAEYETLKMKEVLKSPDIWRAWTWGDKRQINKEVLDRWAQRFFAGCPESWCGQGLDLGVLGKGDLVQADLRGANLVEATLVEADLSGANLYEADLRNIMWDKTVWPKNFKPPTSR